MTRRSRDREDRLGELLNRVERRFQNTSLAPLADVLAKELRDLKASAQAGFTPPALVESTVAHAAYSIDLLPQSFGERFTFDSHFLLALAEDCTQGSAQFSSNLIPKAAETWGHQTVTPFPAKAQCLALDVIHLPGEDNLADVDLLSYPFACHELGHNALFKQSDLFAVAFTPTLDDVVNGYLRQMLGLQGSSRQIAEATIEQIRQYWTPTPTHYNWAHEIAVDVVALWVCGPPYLAALQDVLEQAETNPYQLGQSHPPYEVRAKAMIEAANQLGWAYYTGDLQALVDTWPATQWVSDRTNLYAACADPKLLTGSLSTAVQVCSSLALPRCSAEFVASVNEKLRRQDALDFGIETLVAAWSARIQMEEEPYLEWERRTIRGYFDQITR